VSLLPLFAAGAPTVRLAAYADSTEAHLQFGVASVRSLTEDGWKYILAPKPELYHLEDDPHELSNLAADRPEIASRLREEMRRLIAEAPPPPPPEFATATLDRSDVARLESLGYVGAQPRAEDVSGTELDRFEPHGRNAADFAAFYRLGTLAHRAAAANRLDEAERLLRPLIEQLPDAPRPLTELADILHREGRAEESFTMFQRALAVAPQDNHVRGLYGEALLGAGRWDDAVAQFTEILRTTPDDTIALYSMGIALASLQRFDEARAHFELALKIEPNNARVLHGLGVLCSRENRAAEAADYFAKALAIDPNFKQCAVDLQRVKNAPGP
jgi:tetratricopeptide (TPR) repeat protein